MTSKTVEDSSGTSTDDRTSFVVGNISSVTNPNTITSVSTADLNILAVGETISHAAFPAGTTVVSKNTGAGSFVVSNNATASATGATIGFENRLNQIMKQVVTPAGGSPTTWRYAYDANGCMTSKTDGTNTWTYTWDEDDRLTRVQGPGGVDVRYQYGQMGHMLTRTSGGVTTKFTWDGWNCVKEDDGTNVFRWYCPQGELHSFERNSTFYQVHSDVLGSVRTITDSTGAVVGSYTYGAWGETLSASDPSGFTFPYRFVGAYGIRFDPTTGLHYMRNRWYDPELGRFLSRDALMSLNRYEYCLGNPVNWVDPMGTKPTKPTVGWDSNDNLVYTVPGQQMPDATWVHHYTVEDHWRYVKLQGTYRDMQGNLMKMISDAQHPDSGVCPEDYQKLWDLKSELEERARILESLVNIRGNPSGQAIGVVGVPASLLNPKSYTIGVFNALVPIAGAIVGSAAGTKSQMGPAPIRTYAPALEHAPSTLQDVTDYMFSEGQHSNWGP